VSAARLALVTVLATPLLQAQNDSPDGLTLLQQMSQHYARATSWYIEATPRCASPMVRLPGNFTRTNANISSSASLPVATLPTEILIWPKRRSFMR
jgi:hypothetical protein